MTPNLFDPSIPIFKRGEIDDSGLQELKEKYRQYDESYVANACYEERRVVFEEAFSNCHEYLDKDFISELSKPGKFLDRVWELCICSILLHNGYTLEKPPRNKKPRPDFCIIKDNRKIWIEAVCPDRGEVDGVEPPPNREPGVMYSYVGSIEETIRPRVLRVTSACEYKLNKKRKRLLESGVINENDPYILAVNTHRINHHSSTSMIEERTLYGMGLQQINLRTGESWRQFVPSIDKKTSNGNLSIPGAYFLRPEYKSISAIIFLGTWFDFGKNWKDILSDSTVTYFNHNANNPIKPIDISFGEKKIMEIDGEKGTLISI